MRKIKRFGRKILGCLSALYKRGELVIDALCVMLSVSIITFLPAMYTKMNIVPVRVVVTLLLLVAVVMAVAILVRRIVKRGRTEGSSRAKKLRMLCGAFITAIMVWLGSNIIVEVMHPSLAGVYSVGMTEQQKDIITAVNSLLFVLYSQILITLCTCAYQSMGIFLKNLGKVLLYTFIPLGIVVFASVSIVNILFTQASVGRDVLNAMFTSFLWITSITVNENIVRKRGEGAKDTEYRGENEGYEIMQH